MLGFDPHYFEISPSAKKNAVTLGLGSYPALDRERQIRQSCFGEHY
jgi:hypothetical protein